MLHRTEFSFDSPETSQAEADVSPLLLVNQAEQQFHHNLTLGIEEKLKENRMIKDIKLIVRKPLDKLSLSSWERKYCLSLPPDLREYYQSTNGFRLAWSLEHAGETLRIGEMNVNPINQLIPVDSTNPNVDNSNGSNSSSGSSSLQNHNGKMDVKNSPYLQMSFAELEQNISSAKSSIVNSKKVSENLSLGLQGKAFRLDSNRSGWGTVCLVYPKGGVGAGIGIGSGVNNSVSTGSSSKQTNPPCVEIWFMDPSCKWHFLAPTFTHYYRMLLIHLGLPQWQYRFTPFGLSSWAEQMFWIVAPHLLQQPKISYFSNLYSGLWSPEIPAEAATPNTTVNVISMNLFRKKKKDKPTV